MKTITINLYSFSELSEEAQQKAISNLSDINTMDSSWYGSLEEDAFNIGLKISSLDIDRRDCRGDLIESLEDSIQLVLNNHGEMTETYKTAKTFLTHLTDSISDGEYDDLKDGYLNEMLHNYLEMFKNELEYQESNEAIIETIEANDYYFLSDGTLHN